VGATSVTSAGSGSMVGTVAESAVGATSVTSAGSGSMVGTVASASLCVSGHFNFVFVQVLARDVGLGNQKSNSLNYVYSC
jgi:hypothetical protein